MAILRPERFLLPFLFLVWIGHLLLYAWLVPPWQHYDEPTHFEYALLIRELGQLPGLEEQLPELRRQIAASMIEEGFFSGDELPISAPDLDSNELSLGINERGHPPLYYTLIAVGTLPFQHLPIATQLRAARCLSVALAALLFPMAWAALRLLLGESWQLRCAILAALVLQPAFADAMSSINSDVLANVVGMLLLVVGLMTVRRPDWRTLLLGIAVLVLAWNTKRVLLIYSLVIPLAWLLAAPPRWRQAALVAAGTLGIGVVAVLATQPRTPADWQTSGVATVATPAAQDGQRVFALRDGDTLEQTVYPYRLLGVTEQTLTFGVWMRADRAVTLAGPALQIGDQVHQPEVRLGPDWQLVTFTADLPPDTRHVAVKMSGTAGATVYADQLALVAGVGPMPVAGELDGTYEAGVATPQAPRNLIRNASGERQIPRLPAYLEAQIGAQTLSTLFNPRWIAAVYPRQMWLLFVGAWGVFGWGQYAISPGWFTPLAALALASIAGSVRLLWGIVREQNVVRWKVDSWVLCALAVALGWGAALLRVHSQPFPGAMFWSFGRYTFVAMLPSLVFFVAGFRALFPAVLRDQATAAQLAFLVVLTGIGLSVFV